MTTTPSDPIWKQRYRTPSVFGTNLAATNPSRGIATVKDTSSVHLATWNVETSELRRLVDTYSGWISPSGDHVYYLKDFKGSELGHIVRVPFEGGEAEDMTPDLPDYTLRGFDISRAGNRLVFDAVNADGYQYYVIDLSPTGEGSAPRLVYQTSAETWESLLSANGDVVVAKTSADGERRRYSLLALSTEDGTQIGTFSRGPESNSEPIAFSPLLDDLRLLATTTNADGFKRPVIWDVGSNERIDLSLPQLNGEIEPLVWSSDGQQILLLQSHMAQHQLYRYRLADVRLTKLAHPAGTIRGGGGIYHTGKSPTCFGPDNTIWVQWEDAATPPRLIVLDPETGEKQGTILKMAAPAMGRPLKSVNYTSSDGQTIQGWVGVPDGDGPFPTILHIHGGPHGTEMASYSPAVQSWLDHGFAYMGINFRGSLGFGIDFRAKIEGNIGHWELEDMVAARQWLVSEGLAHPHQIFLQGASYGGFLTLLGLGKRPDLWAGGLALVAIADWVGMYEDSSDAMKGYARVMFGGAPTDYPDRYHQSSPSTYLENVRVPLLVIQGRHDSRAPSRQFEEYAIRMEELGKPLEVVWFDAGHGSGEVEQMIAFQEKMLNFAQRVVAQ
ncbi:MAG: prolyl oligopeptidase family serine peptidase [Chloroflexota bacterium]